MATYLLQYFLIFLEDYLYPCQLPCQASCIMRNMLPFLKHAKMSIQDNVRNLHPKYWKYLQDKSLRSWSYLQTKITCNRKNRVKIYHYFIKLFHLQILARSKGCFELWAYISYVVASSMVKASPNWLISGFVHHFTKIKEDLHRKRDF